MGIGETGEQKFPTIRELKVVKLYNGVIYLKISTNTHTHMNAHSRVQDNLVKS